MSSYLTKVVPIDDLVQFAKLNAWGDVMVAPFPVASCATNHQPSCISKATCISITDFKESIKRTSYFKVLQTNKLTALLRSLHGDETSLFLANQLNLFVPDVKRHRKNFTSILVENKA